MIRSVEGRFHEVRNLVLCILQQSTQKIAKDCAMEENVLENRFKVMQAGHFGFSAEDAKELKTLNRTIKVDVHSDEMNLEADTELVRMHWRP